jgi:hypothetical protein
MGRPKTGKRTLGNSLFIRVPLPAAITMAVAGDPLEPFFEAGSQDPDGSLIIFDN